MNYQPYIDEQQQAKRATAEHCHSSAAVNNKVK